MVIEFEERMNKTSDENINRPNVFLHGNHYCNRSNSHRHRPLDGM